MGANEFWGPACRNCKQIKNWVHCNPMRIEKRSVNNKKRVFIPLYFCSPECLTEFTQTPEWAEVFYPDSQKD